MEEHPRRRWRLLTPRTAVLMVLAVAVVLAARLSHLNPVKTVVALADTVTGTSSTSPGGSASDQTYCPESFGGWAPTFRWHYGEPTPDAAGFDDSYSPSVQPDCTDGSLKITLVDKVVVGPNTPFWAGYDFHTANKPQYTLTANPTIVLNLVCPDGSKPPFSKSWPSNTYLSTPNYWTQDNNNNQDPSGFQSGAFTFGNICGGQPVTVTGGTFYAQVSIT